MRLQGRRILIAAASGATAEAIALLCAQEGARLALTSRDGEHIVPLMARVRPLDAGAVALEDDPTTQEGAASLVQQAVRNLGGLDGMVYNVGGFVSGGFRTPETLPEDWARMLRAHLEGAFYVLRAALPHLAQSATGSAVVIGASEWTRQRGNVAYAVAKGAQVPLVRKIAREFREDSVRVNLVQPQSIDERPVETPVAIGPKPLSATPTPEDIAFLCAFLLSDESRMVTGQVITVDGGKEL